MPVHSSCVHAYSLDRPGSGAHFYDPPSVSRSLFSIHLWCFARLKGGVYPYCFSRALSAMTDRPGSGAHFYDSLLVVVLSTSTFCVSGTMTDRPGSGAHFYDSLLVVVLSTSTFRVSGTMTDRPGSGAHFYDSLLVVVLSTSTFRVSG